MTCTSLGQDAQGVCRLDGIVVFVPNLLPGEKALVRIVKPERNYAYGRVEKRLNDAPERQTPFCPVSKRCGGCTCQHMTYSASLEYKRQQAEELLKRIARIDYSVPPVLGMDNPYQYRNKGVYPFGLVNGSPVCGFFAPRSHDLIPLPDGGCLIQDADSYKAITVVLDWARKYSIQIYDEERHSGLLRHLMTRRTTDGTLMVVVVATKPSLPAQAALVSSLCSALPALKSIALSVSSSPGNTVLGQDIRILYGHSELQDHLMGLQFAVSPLSFFQVNPVQTQKLYQLALDYAHLTGSETVIDAYCGTGTISLLLARAARKVIGIEIVDPAVENAWNNARDNHISNVEFIAGATEVILPKLVADGLKPDVIVLDPPRKGCDTAVLDSIIAASPERIVYVSCSVPTLARDLQHLTKSGYLMTAIQCVDMFCWTSSIETVVQLSKGNIQHKSIQVDFPLDDLDTSCLLNDATYKQIQDYVLEHTDLKVSCLYIAQVKAKHGIIERECYNKPKTEGSKVPKCPPEKEKAIEEALLHFKMIKNKTNNH